MQKRKKKRKSNSYMNQREIFHFQGPWDLQFLPQCQGLRNSDCFSSPEASTKPIQACILDLVFQLKWTVTNPWSPTKLFLSEVTLQVRMKEILFPNKNWGLDENNEEIEDSSRVQLNATTANLLSLHSISPGNFCKWKSCSLLLSYSLDARISSCLVHGITVWKSLSSL